MADNIVKIIELVEVASDSFSGAVRSAVSEASKTIRGITGVDVLQSSAKVGENGEITEYHVNVKIAFALER